MGLEEGLHTRTCHISLRRILGQSEEAPFLIKQRKLRKQSFCLAKPTHVIRSDGQDGIGVMTKMSAFFHTDVPIKGFHTLNSSGSQVLVLSGPCAPRSLCPYVSLQKSNRRNDSLVRSLNKTQCAKVEGHTPVNEPKLRESEVNLPLPPIPRYNAGSSLLKSLPLNPHWSAPPGTLRLRLTTYSLP